MYLNIAKNGLMSLLPTFKSETQIIISQTCPPKQVYEGLNIPTEIRNSIKYEISGVDLFACLLKLNLTEPNRTGFPWAPGPLRPRVPKALGPLRPGSLETVF